MLKTLVAVRFKALVSGLFKGRKQGKPMGAGKKILIGLLGVYIVAVYAALFFLPFLLACGEVIGWRSSAHKG